VKLKKLDYVVILILTLFTIASFIGTILYSNKKYNEIYVEIEVDGKLYKKVPLENHEEIIKIESAEGTNIIEITQGKVHVEDANCPDKVCVKDGFISKPGQILVCLPNRVLIQIKGQNDDIIDSSTY
jgi:hypothetical protein